MSASPFLISPQNLASRLAGPGLSIVDASWYLPAQNRDARAEFEAARIPGAVFFDHDKVVEPASTLPHTLPSPANFAEAVGPLGIAETDTIVVYDGFGLFSAPRAWWMLRTFGARNVLVLDGGFPAWEAAGLAVERGAPEMKERKTFRATFRNSAIAGLDDMRRFVASGTMPVADARSTERFEGRALEPRAGVRGGHMPGARSLPFTELIADGRLKPPEDLQAAFRRAGIDPSRPVVTSCGSGVTAAVINLALETLGNDTAKLYDGSWTEWGSMPDTPVDTGPAQAAENR